MTQPILARFQLSYGEFALSIDLQLPGKGITVLFGHSGSGKTSLLRCIAGLQRAPQGWLQVNGQVWQNSERNLFLPTYKRPLGYVFQEANLFAHLTVLENLKFGLKRLPKPAGTVDFEHILDLLGIRHLLTRLPGRLSGGERQRVAIARALVLNPDVLLMDEPLASLDYQRKQELLPYFAKLHQELNIPVLYVTHSQREVAQLADYLVILEQGKVTAAGTLAEITARLDLPWAQDRQAGVVWEGSLVQQEPLYHLSRVDFAGVSLSLPAITAAIGSQVRIQICANDVSIALVAPQATSILNVLPATVLEMADDQAGQCLLQLSVGTQLLLAHITYKSVQLLGLRVGDAVYAQIKSTSIF